MIASSFAVVTLIVVTEYAAITLIMLTEYGKLIHLTSTMCKKLTFADVAIASHGSHNPPFKQPL